MLTDRAARLFVAALWLPASALSLGCGGKSHSEHSVVGVEPPSSGGARSTPPSFCEATLEMTDQAPTELVCAEGIQAIGGGLYRLKLRSADGDEVIITLPSLESGFFAASECASASLSLSHGGTYFADPPAVDETVAVLRLQRDGDELNGTLEGIFADYVADNGSPGSVFLTPTVRFAHVAITRPELECDCADAMDGSNGDRCQIPTCDTGQCYLVTCEATAAVCAMP